MVGSTVIFMLFLSLFPILGSSCSCNSMSDPQESLKNGICNNENVYSGVVLSATCTCLESVDAQNRIFDCRTFSYSEDDDTYTEEIVRRVTGNFVHDFAAIINTCDNAESILAPNKNFTTGEEPAVRTTEDISAPRFCPFNDKETVYVIDNYVCAYKVKVSEVFLGNLTKDETLTDVGPDTGTSCSLDMGRILQLREEYLIGVGGGCSSFMDWSPISSYSSSELDTLRELGKTKDPEMCGSSMLAPMIALMIAVLVLSMLYSV